MTGSLHESNDDDHDHDHEDVAPTGPIAQSVAVGFRSIYVGTVLLAAIWLASNAREIAADTQAVVFHTGRIARVQEAGLLLALPAPFEQVRLLPGPDRQLSQEVQGLPPSGGIAPAADDATDDGTGAALPPSAAPYLTGDGNVVLLNATLIYRIVDPRAFIRAQDHVQPALDRLFRTDAVQVTAGRQLNDLLVARSTDLAQSNTASDAATTDLRAAVREALLQGINGRLAALAASGQGLGVEVERIDLTASLPPEAKIAFDAVLTATQEAERGVAAARTAGELRRQVAARQRDQLISGAQASATEQLTNAHAHTASIVALQREETPQNRDTLLLQAYRTHVATIMRRAGTVTTIDPRGGAHVIMSGGT